MNKSTYEMVMERFGLPLVNEYADEGMFTTPHNYDPQCRCASCQERESVLWNKTAEEEKELARARARKKGLPFKESDDSDDADDHMCKCGGERFRREEDGSLTCNDCGRNTMPLDEVAPPGYEKVVKGLKKSKSVDNPWAVAWSMKNKGVKPKNESALYEARDRVSPSEVGQTWEDLYVEFGPPDVEQLASWLGSTEEAVAEALPGWLTINADGVVVEKGMSSSPPARGSGQYDIKIPK